MGQLGKGPCACGSGLKFKKCCGARQLLPREQAPATLSEAGLRQSALELLEDYPEPFCSSVEVEVNAGEQRVSVVLTLEGTRLEFSSPSSHSPAQGRAFLAAHIDKLATRSGVFATPS